MRGCAEYSSSILSGKAYAQFEYDLSLKADKQALSQSRCVVVAQDVAGKPML